MMTRKDEYRESYHNIIDKVNERHMELERKKFERNINSRSTNLIMLIIALLIVIAVIVLFVLIGFQPQQETAFFDSTVELIAINLQQPIFPIAI